MTQSSDRKHVLRLLEQTIGTPALSRFGTRSKLGWLAARPDDHRLQHAAESVLFRERCQQLVGQGSNPFGHCPTIFDGDLLVGRARHCDFLFPLQLLVNHILVISKTGGGKTSCLKLLLIQVAMLIKGIWVFELRKPEFRRFRSLLRQLGLEVYLCGRNQLALPVLEVPSHVDPHTWMHTAAELICQATAQPPVARHILLKHISKLYDEFGVINGGKHFPTLFDLRESLAKSTDNRSAVGAILNRLDAILFADGCCYRWQRSYDIEQLSKRIVFYDLRGLAPETQHIAILLPTLQLFTSRIAAGASNAKLTTWIVFDEAQRIFSERYERTRSDGQSLLSELTTQVRSAGLGLCACAQSTHDLSHSIMNVGLRLMGPLSSFDDFTRMGQSLGMNAAQRESAKYNLRPGVMIAQSSDLTYRRPFPFQVPLIDESQLPVDSTNLLSGLGSQRAKDSVRISTASTKSTSDNILSTDELRLLISIANHPNEASTFYGRACGLGTRKAIQLRRDLVVAGYIREHAVQRGRGGRSILLELTTKATQLLADQQGKDES